MEYLRKELGNLRKGIHVLLDTCLMPCTVTPLLFILMLSFKGYSCKGIMYDVATMYTQQKKKNMNRFPTNNCCYI